MGCIASSPKRPSLTQLSEGLQLSDDPVANPIVVTDPFADDDEQQSGSVGAAADDDEGEVMVNQYRLVRTLGKGAMGTVKLGIASGEKYAVKCMSKQALCSQQDSHREGRKWVVKTGLDKVRMEIAVMKKMQHPNVVKFHEVIESEEADPLYIVMEYVANGEILTW